MTIGGDAPLTCPDPPDESPLTLVGVEVLPDAVAEVGGGDPESLAFIGWLCDPIFDGACAMS